MNGNAVSPGEDTAVPLKRAKFDPSLALTEDNILALHNAVRLRHGAPPLELSRELSESATIWASKIAKSGYVLYDDEDPDVSQSIEIVQVGDENEGVSMERELIDRWYREFAAYDFSAPGWRRETVHFTQMIWRATTDIGVGVAPIEGDDKIVVVIHYYPAGNDNFKSKFKENVLPVVHDNGHSDDARAEKEFVIVDGEC